jgi:HK97 family phage prohead protease
MREAAPFQLDVLLDAKADVAEADSGDGLWIEGWASDFEVDRQDEAFEPNAFTKAIAQYLKNPVLLYHHMSDKAVGQVKDLKLVDGQGMYVKAWLDKPADGTEDANIYNKVKSKTIRAFSVGGIFRRKMTPHGPRIHEVDLREISITPLPVNPRSLFEVAGKAFGSEPDLAAAIAGLDAALDAFEGKAYEGGYLRTERPTIHTPGDIAKAVDRAAGNVEDAKALREYLIREAEAHDCMVLIPAEWLN